MASILLDEYELLGDARYRSYISAIDKALKSFEYTSEWADLISALCKLNKVLLSNVKYPVIPRRVIISKRLAQCMHPALPSGVHLKALETYDIIFKCIGPNRLSQELFIYSAGLFPLLGNAAMNVKPCLLSIYENHFVPLREKLRPGLNGFLIGVLPGLEEGSEYYDRTDELLQNVCNYVEKRFFYGCMWKCIHSNPTIRLPAITFIINHFNRKLSMEDQIFVIGTDIDTMVQGLCSSLQDSSVLVQRCSLDLLLLGFPVHSNQVVTSDMIKLTTSAITVLLRRDMSLNRRLFSWLMGTDSASEDKSLGTSSEKMDKDSYFKRYSKTFLLKALQVCFDDPQSVMSSNGDLWCYRLLISLLDRPEIGSIILDDILIDIFRSLFLSCKDSDSDKQKLNRDKNELKKAANLLFGTLEPSHLWEYSSKYFDVVCHSFALNYGGRKDSTHEYVNKVGSGCPTLVELCTLVSFLLDVVSLETYLEAKTEHLPKLLCNIFDALARNCTFISVTEISIALKLCIKLLCKIQPPLINSETINGGVAEFKEMESSKCTVHKNDVVENESMNRVESTAKEEDDNWLKVEQSEVVGVQTIITSCEEKFHIFVVRFITEKMVSDSLVPLSFYDTLVLKNISPQISREKQLESILLKCLSVRKTVPSPEDISYFKQLLKREGPMKPLYSEIQTENITPSQILCQTFGQLAHLLKELSSFPTFYTNSKDLYDKHLKTVGTSVIPDWLKLLISLVCFVSEEDIFFSAATALFDLIALTKSALRNNEINEVAKSLVPVVSPQTHSSTVILVALTPAVNSLQLEFLSNETLLYEVVSKRLWNYVGSENSTFCFYGTRLLQEVHNLSPEDSVCETIICQDMNSAEEMKQIESQKKFSIFWHLTRDLNFKSTPSNITRIFDRCLFLMLDNLGKETGPLKAISQAWLNHSLQRGDLARFLEPLLLILLHPDSARVSVQHVSVHCPKKVLDQNQNSQQEEAEAKVYAISSISGHVIYHVSDDSHPSSPQASPEKKILALTSIMNVDSNKGSTVVTHDSMLQDFELPSSHERDLRLPISVFVNPFGSLSSLGSDTLLDYDSFNPPDLSQIKRITSARRSSFDDDIGEENNVTNSEVTTENIVASLLEDILMQVSMKENEKELSSGDFSYNDYNDFVLPNVCDINSSYKHSEYNRMTQVTVHPLHTFILLYSQIYDSQKTLYALYSLKAIILTNPRIALCSMATTNVSNSLTLRGQQLQILLARHRKSVFGNNFHGELAAEATTVYRSNTYVEVIVAACLYHLRSLYPNFPYVRLTDDQILGNRNVRLLCIEVLTLTFSELVGIVKDSGRSFASYLNDLLNRSKVQKTLLHCLAASVYDSQSRKDSDIEQKTLTFTETIVEFNEKPLKNVKPSRCCANDFQDTYQVHLLRLMVTVIVLEDTIIQNISEKDTISSSGIKSNEAGNERKSNSCSSAQNSSKYQPGIPIPCQAMFLSAILTALRLEHHAYLHIHWLSLVTSALPFVGRWLPRLVMTVVNQLCSNLENFTKEFNLLPSNILKAEQADDCDKKTISLPPDYLITIIEGLTTLCHYCLLECPSPVLPPLTQAPLPPIPSQPYAPGTSASQIISNLIHVFSTSSNQKDASGRDSGSALDPIFSARRVLLSNLPNVIASIASIFCVIKECEKQENDKKWGIMGTPKAVKQHILSFLSPIALNHGPNFIAALAVVWYDSRDKNANSSKKVIPVLSEKQLLVVELVAAIKVFPLESIIQTIRTVLKQPPPMSQKLKANVAVEVNTLQFFLAYIQQTSGSHLIETWPSLLGLWRDGLQISSALVQFHLLALLHEFVQRSPLLEDKKSQKDLQDIAHKLIEACSSVAYDSLEQTTWLWRNLAVKPGPQSDVSTTDDNTLQNDEQKKDSKTPLQNNAQYSVQALCSLAEFLAPVLDFVYVGDEKEKVVPLLSSIMHYVSPYLKNHSVHNVPSFRACCQLLANISGYQHTRKAWRKEAFELLLDPSFFQMTSVCIRHWRSIIDHLMTHDKTTFRDFMSRVSVAQSGSLNLFSSKEQEYEQRAQLLKRLAFVIFCSEIDQYQKFMPDIQERLTESLRISHVPIVQAQVFLCFRVLLIRMSAHHVTSLWPIIITEMVQVFTHIEYDLCADGEEFSDGVGLRKIQSSHLRRMSTLDSSWVLTSGNGLNAHNHPAWLHLYLSVCKLLDMTVALPANILPQFQMYRWAFIGDSPPLPPEFEYDGSRSDTPEFTPHIMRLANLLNKKVPSEDCLPLAPGQLLLTMQSINSILQLQPFFNTLSNIKNQKYMNKKVISETLKLRETNTSPISKSRSAPDLHSLLNTSSLTTNSSKTMTEQIEMILEADFLEACIH